MKKSEIKIGEEYLTKVGNAELVRVKALEWRTAPNGRSKVYVERVDTGRALKPRDPAALRPVNRPIPPRGENVQ